jgi:heat shock protein HslJ
MLPKKLAFLIGAVLVLSQVACTAVSAESPMTDVAPTPGSETSLANTSWRLVSYGKTGSETPAMEGPGVTLKFEDGSQVVGSAGCNTFGATYEVSAGSQLSITKVVSTLMACSDEALMEQETQYLEALQSAESFEISEDSLSIRYGGGQGVLEFSRTTSGIPNSVYL